MIALVREGRERKRAVGGRFGTGLVRSRGGVCAHPGSAGPGEAPTRGPTHPARDGPGPTRTLSHAPSCNTDRGVLRASESLGGNPEGARKLSEVGTPFTWKGGTTDRPLFAKRDSSASSREATRKVTNFSWAGRSQRKLWWRPVAVLTRKLMAESGKRGERLIESSSSWFLSKFPLG